MDELTPTQQAALKYRLLEEVYDGTCDCDVCRRMKLFVTSTKAAKSS